MHVAGFDQGPGLYLRLRGKVTGPFSQSDLQRMREQGRLSAFHEVSLDQQSWMLASEAGLLQVSRSSFPMLDLEPNVALSGSPMALQPASAPQQQASPATWYHVDGNGTRQGPLTREQMGELLGQGTLKARSLIWTEGMADWMPITETELSSLLPATTKARAARTGGGAGLIVAGILLLFLGIACFALAWAVDESLGEPEDTTRMTTVPPSKDKAKDRGPPKPEKAIEEPPEPNRSLVYVLVAAGVGFCALGITLIALGSAWRKKA